MTRADRECEVAVVGLGLIGAGALRHLAAASIGAVGIGPAEPPELASHTGVFASHYDSGRITRKLDARFQWNHALAFGPESDEKSKIEKKLQTADSGK